MNQRQKEILSILVDDYVREARPISSGFLASRHQLKLKCSPATVRNELAELLSRGYLRKIYFSSGSVPTNKAYRLVVDGVLLDQPNAAATDNAFDSLERAVSFLSREFGTLTAGVDQERNLFIDGIDELFGQPDFQTKYQYQLLGRLVEWLQEMQEMIAEPKQAAIFVGRENPYWDESDDLSWLVGSSPSTSISIMAIGPTRMPYKKNWKTFCEILNNL